jgi:hypothetical protein
MKAYLSCWAPIQRWLHCLRPSPKIWGRGSRLRRPVEYSKFSITAFQLFELARKVEFCVIIAQLIMSFTMMPNTNLYIWILVPRDRFKLWIDILVTTTSKSQILQRIFLSYCQRQSFQVLSVRLYGVNVIIFELLIYRENQGRRLRGDRGRPPPKFEVGNGDAYIPPIFHKLPLYFTPFSGFVFLWPHMSYHSLK